MNISFSWLKEYIKTDLTADETAKILTSIGLEVGHLEKYESVKGGLEGLVVGKVLTCEKHENSDHLHVTTVDVGENEPLQIVCGAPNVAANQKVIVATVGTKLYQGEESFTIKRSKIRGVESLGMICAEDEIGIGTSHDGIIVLPENAEVGVLAKDYYKISSDTIIEVDITPNRSDAISHYGVARDLNAYCRAHNIPSQLSRRSTENFTIDNENLKIDISVENSVACPRYSGVTLTNIKVAQSPEWLQNKLLAIGLRPINNVVDATNYLLHAFGQPLHAFDADEIAGKKIVVRNAKEGEKFVTLDEVERTLSPNDLMICDAEKPMCIGGVFGGLNSGVTEKTTSIFIESAYFNPVSIRKSARYHGLNTDASFRFERGINPNDVIYVLKMAAILIKEIAGGEISSEIIDIYPTKINDFEVEVSLQKIHSLIGKNISEKEIEAIFEGLEIEYQVMSNSVMSNEYQVSSNSVSSNEYQVSGNSVSSNSVSGNEYRNRETPTTHYSLLTTHYSLLTTHYSLKVPAYRVDVQRDVDVIEDILRIYGYNNVEFSDSLKSNISYSQKPDNHKLQNLVAEQLTANGFYEIMNNSLTKESYYENLTSFPKEHNVKIINALSNDLSVMRQTLLFGGLESLAHNINRQNANLKFYEFGNCYQYTACHCGLDPQPLASDDSLKAYSETEHLSLWLTGKRLPQSWLRKEEPVTVYDLKSYVQNIFFRLGIKIEKLKIIETSNDIFSQSLVYETFDKKNLAEIGVVSKDILKIFDINQEIFYADINWNLMLAENAKSIKKFEEISKFPEVKRDLALLLDKNVSFSQIEELARKTEKKLLQSVTLFDVYEGKNLPEGKKSYAVTFVLQDKDKTLTDSQIDAVMNNFIKVFEKELDAKLR
ncbi:MAG: phenylalanine--tRNA ligase subunit beta [Prevotellaceae bacterium]|jgi:phenylalanyl-tRNA synthetase beta chain|nr:phenylalanine--tRNA ligase subunit beta [Prevotellaceae bacterium]